MQKAGVEVLRFLLVAIAQASGNDCESNLSNDLDPTGPNRYKTVWNEEEIDVMLKEYQASNSLKVPEVNQPIRIALTGSTKSPSLGLTLSLFDKEESLKRIEKLINFLN